MHPLIDSWFKVIADLLTKARACAFYCSVTKQSNWVYKMFYAKPGAFLKALAKSEEENLEF